MQVLPEYYIQLNIITRKRFHADKLSQSSTVLLGLSINTKYNVEKFVIQSVMKKSLSCSVRMYN